MIQVSANAISALASSRERRWLQGSLLGGKGALASSLMDIRTARAVQSPGDRLLLTCNKKMLSIKQLAEPLVKISILTSRLRPGANRVVLVAAGVARMRE